jgi:hypothetical protein
MARLVHADLAAAGKRDGGHDAVPLVPDRRTADAPLLHRRDEGVDVADHQMEFVHVVLPRRVHADFRRRQPEDEPPLADVHVRQAEHVPQERPVGLRFPAVDDRMRSDDHGDDPPVSCPKQRR